jgi:hypothetical protein
MTEIFIPDDIWENEICKFLSMKDIFNFSRCSKKCNTLSLQMLNNCMDKVITFSYEIYIKNKHKIDSIKNIKKILNLDISIGNDFNLGNIQDDISSFYITLYTRIDNIDFSNFKDIKELYIRSVILNYISILNNFEFNNLESLFLSNINMFGYKNSMFKKLRYLELENCTGVNRFDSETCFTSIETLSLRFMRVDLICNFKTLKSIDLDNISNTTIIYNIPNLRYLKCVSCSINNLENVQSLEVIHLNRCMNISSIDSLYNLKTLYINRCNRIKSIKNLKKLENIHICNWNGEI